MHAFLEIDCVEHFDSVVSLACKYTKCADLYDSVAIENILDISICVFTRYHQHKTFSIPPYRWVIFRI